MQARFWRGTDLFTILCGARWTACPPIPLERISDLAITVQCTYPPSARGGLRMHVRASCDGIHCDTEDFHLFDVPCMPDTAVSKTFVVDAKAMFVKVIVENLCEEHEVNQIGVTATPGGR